MAWIQSHDTIWEHHKLARFCVLTGVCKAQAVGHLHGLWHFVLRNAWKDANLEPWGDAEIERAMFWEGEKGVAISALRKAGFLDGFVVHDWLEISAGLVGERLYNERRRKNAVKTARKRRENPARERVEKSREEKNNVYTGTEGMVKSNPEPIKAKDAYGEPKTDVQKIVMVYKLAKGISRDNRDWDAENFGMASKPAKGILRAFKGNVERSVAFVAAQGTEWNHAGLDDWTLSGIEKQARIKAPRLIEQDARGGIEHAILENRTGSGTPIEGRIDREGTLENPARESKSLAPGSLLGQANDRPDSFAGNERSLAWSNLVNGTARNLPKV